MSLQTIPLAPDQHFIAHAAQHILAFAASADNPRDLSAATLILPNLKLQPALNQVLIAGAGGPLLLPRCNTLAGLLEPWLGDYLPDARRQLILHALLRGRDWLDEGMLWDVVAELTQVFDSLTEHEVRFPADEAALQARLEAAFGLHQSLPLNFEARLVSALWHAEAQGEPSRVQARQLAAGRWLARLEGPLVVMLESSEAGLLQPLIARAAERVPVLVLCPDRSLGDGALAGLLLRVWPLQEAPPLQARMADCAPETLSAARERMQLLAAESLESLGQAVADQVLSWLQQGRRNIALVACDRLAARRARALLEREGVLVQDETGWKMVTTRVAAVVDAWLEVLASDAWHRALIDLLRAPLLFADVDALQRGQGVAALDRLIRSSGISRGLARLRAAAEGEGAMLLDRLIAARELINPAHSCSISEWLRRLRLSLEALGAIAPFEQDLAGRAWLAWLEARQAELAGDESRFRFAAWRTWFNRQMEAELYRDERIESPVIMTHLAATRLRSFEAAVVIGADGEHLAAPVPPGWLAHAGVRRELGLPGLELGQRQVREDLAGLLLASDCSMLAWQCQQRDEDVMPAADVALLQTALGIQGDYRPAHAQRRPVLPADGLAAPDAAPVLPPERVPARLSASAMQTLMDCPYRYYARYVLRLGEQDELLEALEKSDFGEQLHAILKQFHSRYPQLGGHADETLLQALASLTEDAFAGAVARNFQDHAWRLRWLRQLPAYLAWQRAREQAGFAWVDGELTLAQAHELGRGRSLRLEGRIDRLDRAPDGGDALLDYKSRSLSSLRKQAEDPDDVQLAFYALLRGQHVAEAAYVALDGDKIESAPVAEPEARAAALLDCITDSFNAMHEGQPLPAQGTNSACAWCEMRGLCRHEWA